MVGALALCCFACRHSVSPADAERAVKCYDSATVAYVKGNYAEALRCYEKTVALNPNFAMAYNDMGAVYGNQGNYDEAMRYYKKALAVDPNLAEPYVNMGRDCINQGNYTEGIRHLEKAVALNPNCAMAYSNLGMVSLNQGNNAEAIGYLKKAVALDPNLAIAYNNLGAAYIEQENYDESIHCCKKAIALNSNDAKVLAMSYSNLGVALLRRFNAPAQTSLANDKPHILTAADLNDDKINAIRCFEKAIAIDPYCAKAFFFLGISYADIGDAKAISCYERAIALQPNANFVAMAYWLMGDAKHEQGQTAGALAAWQKAAERGNEQAREALRKYGQ